MNIPLKIHQLDIWQEQNHLIKNFSYDFYSQKIYALLGDNGAGKSTLLKTIVGLLVLKPQKILINGQDLKDFSRQKISTEISFLTQHSPIQPYCLGKNRISQGLIPTFGRSRLPGKRELALVSQISQELNICHLLERPLMKMSGGEQRLVHLARCLINPNFNILLLDEPTVYLDMKQKIRLIKLLKNLAKKGKTYNLFQS